MAKLEDIVNPLLFRGRMMVINRAKHPPDTEAVKAQLDAARERSRASTSLRLRRMMEEGKPLVSYTKRCQKRPGDTE